MLATTAEIDRPLLHLFVHVGGTATDTDGRQRLARHKEQYQMASIVFLQPAASTYLIRELMEAGSDGSDRSVIAVQCLAEPSLPTSSDDEDLTQRHHQEAQLSILLRVRTDLSGGCLTHCADGDHMDDCRHEP